MLNNNEQHELMDWLVDNVACPAKIQGELAAFRHGLAVAISALSQKVSIINDNDEQSASEDE